MLGVARHSDQRMRAIIIGAGLMGRHHALAARAVGARIVAVVDPDIAAARMLATRFRDVRAATDLEGALRATMPQIAHVCTPSPTHARIAALLAAERIGALIEKPLAASEAETRTVLDQFGAADRPVCPVHQYAFQRSIDEALRRTPALGELHRIAIDIRSAGGGEDRSKRDQIVGDIISHPLSMIQRLVHHIDVKALDWSLCCAAPGEWLATATWQGILVSISISLGSRPTRFATTVSGSNGTIELDNFHDFAVWMPGRIGRTAKIMQPFSRRTRGLTIATANLAARAIRREGAYPGLRTLTRRFYASANDPGNVAPPISASEILAVAAARDALLALCQASRHG